GASGHVAGVRRAHRPERRRCAPPLPLSCATRLARTAIAARRTFAASELPGLVRVPPANRHAKDRARLRGQLPESSGVGLRPHLLTPWPEWQGARHGGGRARRGFRRRYGHEKPGTLRLQRLVGTI